MKKNFIKAVCLTLLSIITISITGCGNVVEGNEMKEILKDAKFEKGFGAMGITSANGYEVKKVLDISGKGEYDWLIAQWATRHSFADEMTKTEENGEVLFENSAKTVAVTPGKGKIRLRADAGKEYTAPRKNGEDWIHLLIEQVFYDEQRVPFSEMDELIMELKFRIAECENEMTEEEYNPSLHAAQVAWFITVENPDSNEVTPEGRPDYMWFGLSIFDNRSDGMEDNYALDFGTRKLIYSIGKEKTIGEKVEVGKTYTLRYDVLPEIRKAFNIAKENGFLDGAEFGRMQIGSMNLGWELPGTFAAELDIDSISIAYAPKKKV